MLEMICRFGQRSVRDDEQNFQNFSLSSKLKIKNLFSDRFSQMLLLRMMSALSDQESYEIVDMTHFYVIWRLETGFPRARAKPFVHGFLLQVPNWDKSIWRPSAEIILGLLTFRWRSYRVKIKVSLNAFRKGANRTWVYKLRKW